MVSGIPAFQFVFQLKGMQEECAFENVNTVVFVQASLHREKTLPTYCKLSLRLAACFVIERLNFQSVLIAL